MDPQEREELSRLIREQERLQNELSGLSGRLRELEQKLGEDLGRPPAEATPSPPRKTPPPIPEAVKKGTDILAAKLKPEAPAPPADAVQVSAHELEKISQEVAEGREQRGGPPKATDGAQALAPPADDGAATKEPGGVQAPASDGAATKEPGGVQAPASDGAATKEPGGVQAPAGDGAVAQPPGGAQAPINDWELNLGKVWFVRLGVGLVLTGLVFLSLYAYKNWIFNATALVKVSFFFAASLSMVVGGFVIETWRKHLRQYGQVLSAGGLAAGYYTIYAAHFVPALKVIGSPIAAAILLSLWAGGMLAYSSWRKGRVLAVMSIGLAYYGTVVNPSGWISLFSSIVLSASAIYLLLRHRWVWVGAVGLVAAYLSHAFWAGMVGHEVTEAVRITYLTCTWLLFGLAMQMPQSKAIDQALRRGMLGINNMAFWLLLVFHIPKLFPDLWLRGAKLMPEPHEQIGWISIGLGVVWMLMGAATWKRGGWRREYAMLWGFQGLLIATLGLMIEAGGYTRFLMLACEACVLLLAARWMAAKGLRLAAFLCYIASLFFGLLERFALLGDPVPHWLAYFFAALFGFGFVALLRRDVDKSKEEDLLAIYGKAHPYAPLFFAWMPWAVLILGAMLRWDAGWTLIGLCGAPLIASGAYWLSQRREAMDMATLSPFVLGFGGLWALEFQKTIPSWAYATGVVMITAYWFLAEQLRRQLKDLRKLDSAIGKPWIEWVAAGTLSLVLTLWLSSLERHTEAWLIAGPMIAVAGSGIYILTRRNSLAFLLGLFHLGALIALADAKASALACMVPALGILLHVVLLELHFPDKAKALLRPWAGIGLVTAFGGFMEAADWPEPKLWVALSSAGWLAHSLRVKQGAAAITGSLLPLFILSVDYAFSDSDSWLAYLTLILLPAAAMTVSQLGLNADSKSWGAFRRISGGVGLVLLGIKLSAHVMASFDTGRAIVWGLYAVLLFSVGLVLADKLFRRFGLLFLLLALLHIMFVDVLKLDTLGRILSFLTLGAVLLLLGFLYNQFQDKIRKYL